MRDIGANELLTINGPDIYINFGHQDFKSLMNEWSNLTREAHFISKEEMEFAMKR